MFQCENISISEEIDTTKTSASKEDVGFRFETHVCNKCQDVLMTAYELKNIVILNVTNVDFKCIWWGISRDEAVYRLNNSVLEDKVVS